MGILVKHLEKADKPYWEVLTWKRHWWERRYSSVRIVFPFYVEGDEAVYRLDYDDDDNNIIYVHKKPRKLLEKYGVEYSDKDFYAKELRDLKNHLLVILSDEVSLLRNNRPNIPKRLSYWYEVKKLFGNQIV